MGYREEIYLNDELCLVSKVTMDLPGWPLTTITIDGIQTNSVIADPRNDTTDEGMVEDGYYEDARDILRDLQQNQLQAIVNFLGTEMCGSKSKDNWQTY